MKKKLIIISLLAFIISCGGSGGGGGSSSQPTPHNPNNSSNSSNNNANNNGNSNANNNANNNSNQGNNNNNTGNSSGNGNAGNNGNSGNNGNAGSNNSAGNNSNGNSNNNSNNNSNSNFAKPQNSQTLPTGKGVKVGVLDSDFLSKKAKTKNFYGSIKEGFFENETFEKVISEEFGDRMNTVQRGQEIKLSEDEHGLMVATILAGKNGKGAVDSTVYGVSISKGPSSFLLEESQYRDLQQKGVRIYNQSFGTVLEFSEHYKDYKEMMIGFALKEDKIDRDVLVKRVEGILDFYKEAVQEGSLFVWAAGNRQKNGDTLNAPSIQGGLPAYIPELHKGWITVVGIKPDKEEYNPHFARAGGARYWSISASGNCELKDCKERGSSFAAPKVAATAAKIKERFPWMTGHEIQQTILTTAEDIGQPGVDTVFGWGYLDEKKALKGPAEFNNILLVGENAEKAGLKGKFNANIGEGTTSIFENDINGDGGLEKKGKGTLALTGKNTYRGDTVIKEGKLEIYDLNGSDIQIEKDGTLSLFPEAKIVYENFAKSPKSVCNNGGTLINNGSGAVISGDYIATEGSRTSAEIGKNLKVEGKVELNGRNILQLSSSNYIPAKMGNYNIISAEKGIEGNFSEIVSPELIANSVKIENNTVSLSASRKNVEEYVKSLETSDEMRQNVAENIEKTFTLLDKQIEEGNANAEFLKSAAMLQQSRLATSGQILDSLSGQIYASAQALTFEQSRTVNKDLSNRLTMLGSLKDKNTKTGFWTSIINSAGTLKEKGFGEGKTKLYGSQVGIDRKIGNDFILGTAFSYSEADVKFDRYGGKSESKNYGLSLYGRWNPENTPFYIQGRVGVGNVSSKVRRDIILQSNDTTTAKINHDDKVYSGYIETGYNFGKGNFTLVPFVGISHDIVERGAFSEENSQFGLTAEKKKYNQTLGIFGVRAGQSFDFGKAKMTLQGYITYDRALTDKDLSFEASYTGLRDSKITVKGIGLAKSNIWTGIGILTEFNSNFAWYANYDLKSEKNKGHNSVFSTGIRIDF